MNNRWIRTKLLGLAALAALLAAPALLSAQGEVWRIRFASADSKDKADEHRASLVGFADVESIERDGKWITYIGKFDSETQAREAFTNLLDNEGILVEDVEKVAATGTGGGSTRYRVQAGVFDSEAEARALQTKLEESGWFALETQAIGDKWRVLAGFDAEDEAEAKASAEQIRPIAPAATVIIATSVALPTVRVDDSDLSNIDAEERERAKRLLETSGGDLSSEDKKRLDEEFGNFSKGTQDQIRKLQEEERNRERRRALSLQAARLIEATKWNEAEATLIQLKQLDPEDQMLDIQLNQVRKEIAAARSGSTPPPQNAAPTPAGATGEARIDGIVASAEKAEADGDAATDNSRKVTFYADAERLWRDARTQSSRPEITTKADDAIKRIGQKSTGLAPRTPTEEPAEGGLPLGAILGGLAALIALGVGAFFVLGRKKAAPAPVSTMAAPQKTPIPVANKPAPAKAAPAPAAPPVMPPVASPERILPGAFSPAPAADAAPPLATEAPVSIPGIGDTPAGIPPTSAATPLPFPRPDISPSTAEIGLPDTAVPLHTTPPSGIQTVPSDDYYIQTFDEEAVGSLPKNWRGAYDYASLSVVEREEGGRCMKFEKKSGAGSAYFACKFPDATGKILVEFDLCCKDKNKYLLGFYIEKDEEFRHSVHTVVHRDMGKGDQVMLRLQNEPVPYEFGQWVKVKFLIDLTRHLVDGYMNEKPVAIGVRLLSRPKVINTLTIRDNLLTEGVMLIDNIRITRDR
jgi:hypothetical protein